jgi:RNA polymerase sigma factor (sigma-70 family)
VTGDVCTAEDAFQATFLVLINKAGSVRPRHSVGGWLHRTATHVALKARAMIQRRTRHESPRGSFTEPAVREHPEVTDPLALAVLDEEIASLPDGLRSAVVLCELQGISRREAAFRLRIAEGTISSRLAAARKRLAAQLRRRGIGPVCGIAGLLASMNSTEAKVPPTVAANALGLFDGEPSRIKASVTLLVDREIRVMFLTKLTTVATGVIAILAFVAGQWPAASAVAHNGNSTPRTTAIRTQVTKQEPREGVIVVTSSHPESPPAAMYTPDGKEVDKFVLGEAASQLNRGCPLWLPRFSPDGKRLAAIKLTLKQNGGQWTPNQLWVFDLDSKEGPKEALMTDMRWPLVIWSIDGTKLYGSQVDPDKVMDPRDDDKPPPLISWVYDLKAQKKTSLELPIGHGIVDISPDGKTLLTVVENAFNPSTDRSYLVPLDTLKPQLLTETAFKAMRFSPDGKRVLGNRYGKKDERPWPKPLTILSVADGSEKRVPVSDKVSWVYHACWSPDGKRIAYHWHEEIPKPDGEKYPEGVENYKWHASRLTVADADGKNAKTILSREYNQNIQGLDWK